MNEIIVALITACSGIAVALITGIYASKKTGEAVSKTVDNKLEISQAVTTTKLEELTREVREHNNFAKRMPVIEEQIKVINHRIGDLEEAAKKGD